MYSVESKLEQELEKQIRMVLLAMGYNNGCGGVAVDYKDQDLKCNEEYFEVWATTYIGQEECDNHTHLVKIPWKYIFNPNYKNEIEEDKTKEKEIKELKRLQTKYPNIK